MHTLVGSLILTLVLIESFYLGMFHNPQWVESMPQAVKNHIRTFYWYSPYRRVIQYDANCSKYDDELFYTLKPGTCQQKTVEYEANFQVNSLGTRDDEESTQAPEIIVLGDSQAMGWGVQKPERFSELLEQRLGKKVLTLAVSSFGTVRELKMLKRADLSKVETVIIQHASNDDIENAVYLKIKEQAFQRTEDNWNDRAIKEKARTSYYFGKNLVLLFTSFLFEHHPQDAMHGDDSKGIGRTFLQVINKLLPDELRDKSIIVFSVNVQRTYSSQFIEYVDAELSENANEYPNIQTINITADLNSDKYRYIIGNHLNKLGHQLIADQIISVLSETEQ